MVIQSQASGFPASSQGEMLWQVRKGTRHAEACVRTSEHGLELRISVDALVIFNKLKHDTDLTALLRESDVHLGAFVERGWMPQRAAPRPPRAASA